jgi:hypothetical protein
MPEASPERPFFPSRRLRYLLTWFLALSFAAGRIAHGHLCFQDSRPESDPARRRDGNDGHVAIDFGGQWVMGRMLTRGFGQELYHRARQWEVAQQAFPRKRESIHPDEHDAEKMLSWFMGRDNPRWRDVTGAAVAPLAATDPLGEFALVLHGNNQFAPDRLGTLLHPRGPPGIGGPLYPPLHAFVMAPFALSDHPQAAYFAMQWVQLGLVFLAGLGINRMTSGRIWWPVATALLLIYPGCRGTVDLGQNSATTLCILVWGWVLVVHGRPGWGGIVWGLLAYKPVWALSYFGALVLLRQWRALIGMAACGCLLVVATLPFVGIQSWLDWLYVGKTAAALYSVDVNWISLSRDLFGIPRRFFLNFDLSREQRDNVIAILLSWALWAAVLETTIRVYFASVSRATPLLGSLPAFVFFAAWLCTYRFMYYDSLISAFPLCVLLAEPRRFFTPKPVNGRPDPALAGGEWYQAPVATTLPHGGRSVWLTASFVLTIVALMLLVDNVLQPLKIEANIVVGYLADTKTLPEGVSPTRPRMVIGSSDRYPWDTVGVLLLWLWCGLQLFWTRDDSSAAELVQSRPNVGGAHK